MFNLENQSKRLEHGGELCGEVHFAVSHRDWKTQSPSEIDRVTIDDIIERTRSDDHRQRKAFNKPDGEDYALAAFLYGMGGLFAGSLFASFFSELQLGAWTGGTVGALLGLVTVKLYGSTSSK